MKKEKLKNIKDYYEKKRETKNEPWVPRYFTYKEDGEEHQWIFNNTYWEMKHKHPSLLPPKSANDS